MLRLHIITAFLMMAFHADAQTSANKELKSIIHSSFSHFPKLKEAENNILIAEEKKKLVELNRMPDITADAGYAYIMPRIILPINNQKFQFAPVDNFNATLNGTYTILDFGRWRAAIQQSLNDLEFSKHNKTYLEHQLAYQVANIYYYIIYLKKAVAIQDTIIRSLTENKNIIESQVKNGTALEIDLLSIQSVIDGEENKKTEISTLLNKQIILLEYVSGVSSTNGNVFDFAVNSEQNIMDHQLNPDMMLLNDKVIQSQQELSMIQMKNRPMLNMRASMGSRNGYIPNIFEMRFNYLAGISFSMPIYNGGKIRQQVKVQEGIAKQQTLAFESMKSTLDKDLRQTNADINAAKERLARSSSQISLAKHAAVLASNKLKYGTGTHLEVTNANTNLQKTLLNEIQMQLQLCMASLEYARLKGIKSW